MPKCKVCGSRVQNGTVQCPMCGAKITQTETGTQPSSQARPVQPAAPVQPTPQPSYQPNSTPNSPKAKKGCLGKIITAIIVIIVIIIAAIFVRNGFDIDKTVSDVGDIVSEITDSYSTPKDVPLDQYQVASYRDYDLHPEKYYGKYVVFKNLAVMHIDKEVIVFYESNTETITDGILHSYTGQDLDWLAEKNNSFKRGNYSDSVSLYCYISKTGDFNPIQLGN